MDVVFFGAGVSKEFDIPTTREMVTEFRDSLKPVTSDDYIDRELCGRIFRQLEKHPDFDIESLITVLEHIRNPMRTIEHVLSHPALKYFPVLGSSWENITKSIMLWSHNEKEAANRLLDKVKDFVMTKCGVHIHSNDARLGILDRFFSSIFGTRRDFATQRREGHSCDDPLDLFSTNYDRIMETYCRYCTWTMNNGEGEVREGVHSATGGELNLRALVEIDKGCKLYKLHGTVNWYIDEDTRKAMFSPSVPQVGKRDLYGSLVRENMLIFPIREWYTFREPYYPLFHSLKTKLLDCRRCYVVGYSFRDEDILGLFTDAADLNTKLTFCLIDPAAQKIAQARLTRYQERLSLIPYRLSNERTPGMIEDYRRQN